MQKLIHDVSRFNSLKHSAKHPVITINSKEAKDIFTEYNKKMDPVLAFSIISSIVFCFYGGLLIWKVVRQAYSDSERLRRIAHKKEEEKRQKSLVGELERLGNYDLAKIQARAPMDEKGCYLEWSSNERCWMQKDKKGFLIKYIGEIDPHGYRAKMGWE